MKIKLYGITEIKAARERIQGLYAKRISLPLISAVLLLVAIVLFTALVSNQSWRWAAISIFSTESEGKLESDGSLFLGDGIRCTQFEGLTGRKKYECKDVNGTTVYTF